jgi:hypothetical protein
MGIVANLQMQVRGPALHGDAQQVINIHSTLPPNNLPYDDAKSHTAQDDLSNKRGRGRGKPFGWEGWCRGGRPRPPGGAKLRGCSVPRTRQPLHSLNSFIPSEVEGPCVCCQPWRCRPTQGLSPLKMTTWDRVRPKYPRCPSVGLLASGTALHPTLEAGCSQVVLYADRLLAAHGYGRQPLVLVGLFSIDDGVELFLDRLGDGADHALADADLVH